MFLSGNSGNRALKMYFLCTVKHFCELNQNFFKEKSFVNFYQIVSWCKNDSCQRVVKNYIDVIPQKILIIDFLLHKILLTKKFLIRNCCKILIEVSLKNWKLSQNCEKLYRRHIRQKNLTRDFLQNQIHLTKNLLNRNYF